MREGKYRFFTGSIIKYVTREVMFSFLAGTTLFLLIMLMFQVIRLSDFVVIHHVGLKDVGRLSIYLLISFIPITVPISFLFSVLMGISRANSEGEILALQVNGISLMQVFVPLGIFSIFISFIALYFSLYTVPQGNRAFELLITKLGHERVMSTLKPGIFQEGFYGLVLFTEKLIPERNEMKRVFVFDEREGNHPLAVTARAGILRSAQGGTGGMTLRLSGGSIHIDRKSDVSILQKIDFDVYDINLEVAERGEAWRAYSPPSYNYPQLRSRIKETIHDPPMNRQLLVELHRRFAFSFACIVFAMLGFSVGISSQRGIRSTAIIICVFVGVVYWLSYLIANTLAMSGWIIPWIAVWLPNFVLPFVSWFFYRKYASI